MKTAAELTAEFPYISLSPGNGETISVSRKASVPLPAQQANELARELSQKVEELAAVELMKKETAGRYTTQIKDIKGVLAELSHRVNDGDEEDIEHTVQNDVAHNQVRAYRMDTDPPQCVEARAMDEQDHQGDLFAA